MANPWLKLRLTPPETERVSVSAGGVHESTYGYTEEVQATSETKVCSNCKVDLPLDKFYKHPSYPQGRRYECIECVKRKQGKYFNRKEETK
jgi:hypothetical protein